ncbi:MAG TPA: SusC/RagA family TonB-linked outer membrane protein [Bacteroidetes bacterium]|nr:SusC/RagA family TonB-linked outer membrane protein [Bacteroidota bacterium]
MILMFFACIQVSARGYGQITVSVKNAPMQKVLKEIQKQSGYNFLYSYDLIEKAGNISVDIQDASLTDAVNTCIKGKNLTYSIVDNTVVIKAKEADVVQQPVKYTLKGKVTDKNGNPLTGVNVLIKGTIKGAVTDDDGKYSIEVSDNAILVFSFLGYQKKEIAVGNRKEINVSLLEEIAELKEVTVNAGYYTVKEKERTGSISKVDSKAIEKQPVTNPLQALQGRMPGVFIQQQSGVSGSGFSVNIRGINSIAAGNEPMYIIDGVPFTSTSLASRISFTVPDISPFNSINPADIESIEVLKDADATAIYGSRGANGVVLVTTKKGKAGKTKVDINVSHGFSKVGHYMNLLNTEQYLEMRHEAFKNDGGTPPQPWDYDINGVWDTTRYTDWQRELLGHTKQQTNVNVSISGGNELTQFVIGGGFWHETTVFPGDFFYGKGSGHFNLNHLSENKKFRILLSANYTSDKNFQPADDPTYSTINLAPDAPAIYKTNGTLNWENSTWWDNPFAALLNTYENKSDYFLTNMAVSYEILPGLKLKSTLGYTSLILDEQRFKPISAQNPAINPTGGAYFGGGKSKTWIIEPRAEYERKIGRGKLSILVGTTFQQDVHTGEYITGGGYTSDALLKNIKSAPKMGIQTNTYTQYRYQAVFGRLNYNLDGKYIFNITGRRDGSSRFGPGKQFANFGSLGMAWIFSNENFIKNSLPYLSFGKLRASYGTTGNDRIGDYKYLDTYSSKNAYQGSAIVPNRIAIADYAWEENKKLEVGLNLGFIQDRITMEAGWYRNRSSNQLVGFPLPATTGFSSVTSNFPATVQNTGLEFMLNTINIKSKDFSWTSSFNITFPQNKLVAYPGIETSSYRNRYEVGESLYKRKLRHVIGVDPQTGVYIFEDVNGDGNTLGAEDYIAIKKVGQDYFGGLYNSLNYKGWQLDFFLQFVKQTAYDYRSFTVAPGNMNANQPIEVMQRWQKPGDITDIQMFTQSWDNPGLTYYDYLYGSGPASNIVVDASFIRLQNISLSWQLPENLAKAACLQSCRLYLQAQNLFTVTNYIGFDPERGSGYNLPPLRTIAFGIQIAL